MHVLRRTVPGPTVPIPRAAIEAAPISPGALGVYCVIAAAGSSIDRRRLLEVFGANVPLLDARLNELARAELIEGFGR